jgi:hypothetical protein
MIIHGQFGFKEQAFWFNIGTYGKNVSKRLFFETKLPMNDHWKVL